MGKTKVNIPMCAALVLLFLTMISIHLTSGLYARYTTAASGSDSARVAKFDVESSLQPLLDGHGNPIEGKYTLTVTNLSEVTVRYSLTVTMPDFMSMAVDAEMPKSPAESETQAVYQNDSWVLEPGENPAAHTLTFAVDDWSGRPSQTDQPSTTENVGVDFDVTVTAEQVE